MKAYLGLKFHSDQSNRDTIEKISQALEMSGIETVCIQRDVEKWGEVDLSPTELMKITFELMQTCQIVVIDLTEKGVGLGIEAGYAYAHGIPIYTIAQSGSDISATLAGISRALFTYRDRLDLQQFFSRIPAGPKK